MERTQASPAIKPVSQQRSQRTLRRIIDAFATLLHTKTFEEITVAEICRAAGCSVGSFYGRVASKDDLLGHLCERSYTELIGVVAGVVEPGQYEGMEFRTVLEHQVRALTRLHMERRGVLRAMIVHARRRASFGEATRAFNEALVKTVVSGWRCQLEAAGVVATDRTLEMAAVMAAAFLRESLIFAELWPTFEGAEVERLGEELTEMLMSYLCPAARSGEQTRGQTA